MQRLIWGKSESLEAEYSARAAEPFTVAEAMDDEIYVVRGFATQQAALKAVKEYDGWQIEKVGR